jgi:type IV pilus assembly protein PilX
MNRLLDCNAHRLPRQSGVAMVIVLVFVVILTSLGTYALRRAMLNENTSRNVLDLQVARQAAAAALRDAERDILSPNGAAIGAICQRGITRPLPPLAGYDLNSSTWSPGCVGGQCVKGNGVRAENYGANANLNTFSVAGSGGATLAVTDAQSWWPSNDPNTPPPRWNNVFSSKPSATNTGNCNTFTGGVPYGTYTGNPPIPGVWQQPEYLIEIIKTGLIYYYVLTARGWGLSENSEVVVQSIVKLDVK